MLKKQITNFLNCIVWHFTFGHWNLILLNGLMKMSFHRMNCWICCYHHLNYTNFPNLICFLNCRSFQSLIWCCFPRMTILRSNSAGYMTMKNCWVGCMLNYCPIWCRLMRNRCCQVCYR